MKDTYRIYFIERMTTKQKFSEHPKSIYWHPFKNGDLEPHMISYKSSKKYWFKCFNNDCLHDFQSDPNHITTLKNPTWCPYCANQKLCTDEKCSICFKKSFASHLMSKLWYQPKNGDITPRNVFLSSGKKYWVKCNNNDCKHLYEIQIIYITCLKQGCPYCAHRKLCEDALCEPCKRRSFASHPLSKYWDKEKNGDINPRNIFPSSKRNISFWFICDNNHSFHITQNTITNKNISRWCAMCVKEEELQIRSDKYLEEAYEVARERNGQLVSTSYINMNELLEWKCNTCNHEWSACLSSIKQGTWCPKCAGVMPYTLEDCHKMAALNNGKCLSTQYVNVRTPMEWECKNEHRWSALYGHIVNGTWCPHCANRLPKTLEDAKKVAEEKDGQCLSTEYINAKTRMLWQCKKGHIWSQSYDIVSRVTWCPDCDQAKGEIESRELIEKITGKKFNKIHSIFTNKKLELDGYNAELKIGFEHQGLQHYEFVPFFHRNNIANFEAQQKRDQQKREECKILGIHLIEIPYTFVGQEKEDYIRNQLESLNCISD